MIFGKSWWFWRDSGVSDDFSSLIFCTKTSPGVWTENQKKQTVLKFRVGVKHLPLMKEWIHLQIQFHSSPHVICKIRENNNKINTHTTYPYAYYRSKNLPVFSRIHYLQDVITIIFGLMNGTIKSQSPTGISFKLGLWLYSILAKFKT